MLCSRVVVTLLCLLLSLPVFSSEGPITIRFSHVSAEDTPKGQGALLFKRLVEERLAGKVQVEVYPDSTLFGDDQEIEALRAGKVEMLATSLAKFDKYAPKLKVFDLPFLFTNKASLERFQARPKGQQLLQSMHEQNIMGLAYWFNGMKLLAGPHPILEPVDAANLTFRVQPSPVLAAQFKALGANTVQMPISEAAEALADGRIDAVENPWSNIFTQGLNRNLPHITESNHGVVSYMLITNAGFWRKIPFKTRITLDEIINEVTFEVNRQAEALNAESKARTLASDSSRVYALTPEQQKQWREAMRPVWRAFEGEIGSDLIDEAEKASD